MSLRKNPPNPLGYPIKDCTLEKFKTLPRNEKQNIDIFYDNTTNDFYWINNKDTSLSPAFVKLIFENEEDKKLLINDMKNKKTSEHSLIAKICPNYINPRAGILTEASNLVEDYITKCEQNIVNGSPIYNQFNSNNTSSIFLKDKIVDAGPKLFTKDKYTKTKLNIAYASDQKWLDEVNKLVIEAPITTNIDQMLDNKFITTLQEINNYFSTQKTLTKNLLNHNSSIENKNRLLVNNLLQFFTNIKDKIENFQNINISANFTKLRLGEMTFNSKYVNDILIELLNITKVLNNGTPLEELATVSQQLTTPEDYANISNDTMSNSDKLQQIQKHLKNIFRSLSLSEEICDKYKI